MPESLFSDADRLAALARDYVRLDREINFHLRCTAVGEGVPGEYLRLCTEREAVVVAMGEIVDREATANFDHDAAWDERLAR